MTESLERKEFIVCGLSQHTAPVAVRERWAFSPGQARQALHELRGRVADSEHLILSTCNRTEFYSRVPVTIDAQAALELYKGVRQGMGELLPADGRDPANSEHFYLHREEQAIDHLFRVAAGIDSVIVGESQILKQIKDAFSLATEAGATGKFFRRLFPAALRAGKQVRSGTAIANGCTSLGQAALGLSRDVLGSLASRSAIVIGSGEIAELTVQALRGNVRECFVVNRTMERARQLIGRLGLGQAREWERLEECLHRVDLVISSTGSVEPIMSVERLQSIQKLRGFRPLVVVDLAVPRDFQTEAGQIAGVHLFNIDDLNEVIIENVRRRHSQIPEAERIVGSLVHSFQGQMTYLEVEPVIRHLVGRFEQIRLGELQKFIGQFPQESHAAVETLTQSLVKKLLHFPIEKLKSFRDTKGLTSTEVAFLRRMFASSPEGNGSTNETSE